MSFEDVVKNIKYKPCWNFCLQFSDHGVYLMIDAQVMDAYNHSRTAILRFMEPVPFYMEDSDLDVQLDWVHRVIMMAEEHEVGEFFMYKDTRPFDPHKHL